MAQTGRILRRQAAAWIALCILATGAQAETATEEIDHLIVSIGQSDCTFVRNGKDHSAQEAADHLRMKYRRGKAHAKSAEQFIARLASKSSFSGKPYYMKCDGEEPQQAGEWLTQRLEASRASDQVSSPDRQ